MENPTGKISLVFRKKSNGDTYLAKQYYKFPLQIMMPHYYDKDRTAFVYLLNPGGGILQHDRLLTEIESEEGSSAVITTPGSTKFYKMDDGHAEVVNRLTVRKGAVLEYIPEHNVPFAQADARQQNIYKVERGGVLFASDMVTAGRVSRNEIFDYTRYDSTTKFYVDDELVLFEHNIMEPKAEDMSRLGLLEGRQSNGVFYVYADGMDSRLKDEINLLNDSGLDADVYLAAGNVTDSLMTVRFLGDNIIDMQKTMLKVWDVCRQSILGKPSVKIRKY